MHVDFLISLGLVLKLSLDCMYVCIYVCTHVVLLYDTRSSRFCRHARELLSWLLSLATYIHTCIDTCGIAHAAHVFINIHARLSLFAFSCHIHAYINTYV